MPRSRSSNGWMSCPIVCIPPAAACTTPLSDEQLAHAAAPLAQPPTLELRHALEVVVLHEGLQPPTQLLDQWVAVQHHPGAHLQGWGGLRVRWGRRVAERGRVCWMRNSAWTRTWALVAACGATRHRVVRTADDADAVEAVCTLSRGDSDGAPAAVAARHPPVRLPQLIHPVVCLPQLTRPVP